MRLAIIAGDGIGPEVVGEALKVLDAVLPDVEKTSYDLGARRFHATGEVLPDSVLDEFRAMMRSCSARSATRRCPAACWNAAFCCDPVRAGPPHQSATGPAVSGCEQPAGREPGHRFCRGARRHRGSLHRNRRRDPGWHANEVATEVSVNTAFGVRRVVHDAFERAQQRRKHLTLVHKNNVLTLLADCGGALCRTLAATIPKSRWPTSTSMPPPSTSSPTPAGSTSSSPTTYSATSSPTLPRRSAAVSAWPPAAISMRHGRIRRCSNPCTAVHPTSPARHGRSHRGHHVGRAAAGPCRRGRRRGPRRQGRRGAPRHPR